MGHAGPDRSESGSVLLCTLILCLCGTNAFPQGVITTIAGTDWLFPGRWPPGTECAPERIQRSGYRNR